MQTKMAFYKELNKKVEKLSSKRLDFLLKIVNRAKKYGINVIYTHGDELPAYSILEDNLIVIDFEQVLLDGDDELFTVFYHELAHFETLRRGKFKKFHEAIMKQKKRTKQIMHLIVSNAFNVEIYTDKIGKQMMEKDYPSRKYTSRYGDQDSKDFIKAHWRE
jgi:hypothetical protein